MRLHEFGNLTRGFRTLFGAGAAGSHSDSQLLERFLGRSEDSANAAFTALVQRHGPMVLRICLGVLHDVPSAEDAFQATFLILARKAGTIQNRDSVASWLFGVARRVSVRVRAQSCRRAALEQNDPAMLAGLASVCVDRAESMPEIQDEIARLPEKYRAPIVLCYLEGMTHEEAAGQLRLPVGTVKTRLARARERLRGPLVRRGLAPVVIAAWMHAEARAVLSSQLAEHTAQGAISFASGRAAGISAPIVALVEGVLRAMFLARLKTLVACFSAFLCVFVASAIFVSAFSRLARSSQLAGVSPPSGKTQEVVVQAVARTNFQRTTTMSGTVEAFEWANLSPRVSGYLKTLTVDIGDTVKKGQLLAQIEAPQLEAEAEKAQAVVEQARARLVKEKAAVQLALASIEVENAKAQTTIARLDRASASARFRENSLKRIKDLAARNAVGVGEVDEAELSAEAAKADLAEARTQVVSGRAGVEEAKAKMEAARSTVTEAEATLHAAKADLRKALIVESSTRVLSPWGGIVTKRGYHVGDYVRSGDAASAAPLVTVTETGKMRVVADVPALDAPYLDKGDRATVEFASLANPHRVYHGVVARTSLAEDIGKGTQRAEIDLNNADGRLRSGEYCRVTIILQDRAGVLSTPASAVIEQNERGQAACYRIVDGRARRTAIKVGEEGSDRVEVVEGLKEGDSVVANPGPDLADGQPVTAKEGARRKEE